MYTKHADILSCLIHSDMSTHEEYAYQKINCKMTKIYYTLKEPVLPVMLWLGLDKWSRMSSSLATSTQ